MRRRKVDRPKRGRERGRIKSKPDTVGNLKW
jgi:hypothetical protein